jgi:hypothetical protein
MRWLGALRTQLVVLVVSLLVYEIGLQVLAALTPVGELLTGPDPKRTVVIPDERLGVRGNPRYPDHDARGYRNPQALSRADIVTLGDSQTYGTQVDRTHTWPSVLAARTKLSVYNMAVGGYGPSHAELQLSETLTLRPRVIVVGFYFGNDLFDAFRLARRKPASPGLQDLVQRAAAREEDEPLEDKATRLFHRGREKKKVRAWLGEHVMLYALARKLRNHFAAPSRSLHDNFDQAVAALTPTDRTYVSVVDGPGWRTILTAPYRRLVLDQRDPRILLGFELAVGALDSIATRCRREGIDVLVVLIPTKESVFWPRITAPDTHPQLRELVVDEAILRTRLLQRLEGARVDVVDVLPALRMAVAQPFHAGTDGHLSPAGHVVVADLVGGWVLEHTSKTRRETEVRAAPSD